MIYYCLDHVSFPGIYLHCICSAGHARKLPIYIGNFLMNAYFGLRIVFSSKYSGDVFPIFKLVFQEIFLGLV